MSNSPPPLSATREEDPILNLSRAAVSLHVLEQLPARENPGESVYPDCPSFRNMELDLLAYSFQERPPLGSRCEGRGRIPLTIQFPESFIYHSEGAKVRLHCSRPNRKASLLVSSTTFPASGIRVWHLTFTPADGEAFSEFDIIKLIQIYDGRIENARLDKLVRFQLEGGDGAGFLVADLMVAVYGAGLKAAEVRTGTVNISVGISPEHSRMLKVVRGAREPGGEAAAEQLSNWMREEAAENRILNAYCGIITGIVEFDMEMDELLDTLEPTFAEGDSLIRLMRRTLVKISDTDRTMEKCWETIGNSPYLLIPHAVLLHNEAVVDEAERVIDTAARHPRNVRYLEGIRREAELNLNRLHLPNVFN